MITIKELKKNYSYSHSDLKWITSDILEHLGTIVMAVKFKRTKEADPENNIESEWGSETTQALLLGASEFDPMTETYVMRWKEVDDTKPETEWMMKYYQLRKKCAPSSINYRSKRVTIYLI